MPGPSRYTQVEERRARNADICALYASGKRVNIIQRKYPLSKSHIYAILRAGPANDGDADDDEFGEETAITGASDTGQSMGNAPLDNTGCSDPAGC